METQQIVPGIPVAEQRQTIPQSGFTPDDLQMSIINRTFNRSAYENEQMIRQMRESQQRELATRNQNAPATPPPTRQNDPFMNDFNTPEFQRAIAADIARQRTTTAPQQNQVQPSQQAVVPQQNTQQPQQNDQSQKDMFSDDYFKQLFGEQKETKQPEQPGQPAQASTPGMQPDEMSRINDYLQKNADYIDQVQLEAARRGLNPNIVFQQLSKKSIAEMVDFALGINSVGRNEQTVPSNAQQQYSQTQQRANPGPSVTDMSSPNRIQFDATRPGGMGGSYDLNL